MESPAFLNLANMSYVNFVSDEHFKNCVRFVLNSFENAVVLKNSLEKSIEKGNIFKSSLFSNEIDPFKMTFEIQQIGIEEWIRKEVLRQLDKSVEQKMGDFHQKILGGVEGWEDLGIGQKVDLVNREQKIYIELKNKHNTMNSSAQANVRRELENITSRDNEAIAFWAYIIGKKSNPSGEAVWIKKSFNKIDNVKKIWGKELYQMVTGKEDALAQVFEALPVVISDLNRNKEIPEIKTILDEIQELVKPHLEKIQTDLFKTVFGA